MFEKEKAYLIINNKSKKALATKLDPKNNTLVLEMQELDLIDKPSLSQLWSIEVANIGDVGADNAGFSRISSMDEGPYDVRVPFYLITYGSDDYSVKLEINDEISNNIKYLIWSFASVSQTAPLVQIRRRNIQDQLGDLTRTFPDPLGLTLDEKLPTLNPVALPLSREWKIEPVPPHYLADDYLGESVDYDPSKPYFLVNAKDKKLLAYKKGSWDGQVMSTGEVEMQSLGGVHKPPFTPNQQWKFVKGAGADAGYYRIENCAEVGKSKEKTCLDAGGKTESSIKVVPASPQIFNWRIKMGGNRALTIIKRESGTNGNNNIEKCLIVDSSGNTPTLISRDKKSQNNNNSVSIILPGDWYLVKSLDEVYKETEVLCKLEQ